MGWGYTIRCKNCVSKGIIEEADDDINFSSYEIYSAGGVVSFNKKQLAKFYKRYGFFKKEPNIIVQIENNLKNNFVFNDIVGFTL